MKIPPTDKTPSRTYKHRSVSLSKHPLPVYKNGLKNRPVKVLTGVASMGIAIATLCYFSLSGIMCFLGMITGATFVLPLIAELGVMFFDKQNRKMKY